MELPNEGIIDSARLSRIFDKTSAPYKFYWFVSIINRLVANPDRRLFSFDEIIAEMIAEAWYPIHYFRISFGKQDSLVDSISELQRILDIPIDANIDRVRETILRKSGMSSVKHCLHVFTLNVPYCFLSPWIPGATKSQVKKYSQQLFNNCPYSILDKTIAIDDRWAEYLIRNAAILKDFAFWNLSVFLQKRNPNVPEIPSKLTKPTHRASLARQHRFWDRYIASVGGVKCIYTDEELKEGAYALDHFVPWSFVVHDLLWNLLPAAKSVNSSKSNSLPSLERYLEPLSILQQSALRLNFETNPSDTLFEDYLIFRCSIQELVDAPQDRFIQLMKNEFTPMIQTAKNMGFPMWINRPVYE